MENRKFEVIIGKKAYEYNLTHQFVEAHATNTRLMGVVGLRIQWETEEGENFYQFFHLDAEEFGLDDYVSILEGSPESVEMTTARVMGGLGGELIPVSEKEARYLVRDFAKKNEAFKEELPDLLWEYEFILKEEVTLTTEEYEELWQKLCEAIESPVQLANYYIMRAVGMDQEAMDYLTTEKMPYQPVKKPSTLLKNIIEQMGESRENSFIAESLVDAEDGYKMLLTEINVEHTGNGWRICHVSIRSMMNITSTEAAFSLSKDEYITVYHVKNFRDIIRRLEKEKPHTMRHAYEVGLLYTEFNTHNDHVKQEVYYLNNDIHGIYYLTEASQFLVAAYSRQRIEELESYFECYIEDGLLEMEERLHLDRSLLYEFVHSDYDNFYDFLEEGQ